MIRPTAQWLKDKKLSPIVHVTDLESSSTAHNAQIRSIAIVTVDLYQRKILDHLYMTVSLEQQRDRAVDEDTMAFWAKQEIESPEAYAELFDPANKSKQIQLDEALHQVRYYLEENTPKDTRCQLVGNGSEFDNVILANAFDDLAIEKPWPFRGNQSLRTAVLFGQLIAGIDPRYDVEFKGFRHHALHDATHEAECLLEVFSTLSGVSNVNIEEEQQDMFHASLVKALNKPKDCDLDLADLLVEVENNRKELEHVCSH